MIQISVRPLPIPSSTVTQRTDHGSCVVTIVTVSRLVYRKGIDLLVASAPTICDLFPEVCFVVGGDGPKMVDLEQMREKYRLQDRITLLGSVRPSEVQSVRPSTLCLGVVYTDTDVQVLNRGQIYLNTSLTEAFGISTIEAASAGLFVVSTKVGGLPEILPGDMIEFARADEDGESPRTAGPWSEVPRPGVEGNKLTLDPSLPRCNPGTEHCDPSDQIGPARPAHRARAR